MNPLKIFTSHPESVGETYIQHLIVCLKASCVLLLACVFNLIHGLFPFISPPLKLDVKSVSNYLANIQPKVRKIKNEEQP